MKLISSYGRIRLFRSNPRGDGMKGRNRSQRSPRSLFVSSRQTRGGTDVGNGPRGICRVLRPGAESATAT
jgi:hypothetical protein